MKNIVFGIRPVIEAIEAGRQIEKILIKKGADGVLIGELREIARAQRIHIQDVPVEKLDRLTRGLGGRGRDGLDGSHGGDGGLDGGLDGSHGGDGGRDGGADEIFDERGGLGDGGRDGSGRDGGRDGSHGGDGGLDGSGRDGSGRDGSWRDSGRDGGRGGRLQSRRNDPRAGRQTANHQGVVAIISEIVYAGLDEILGAIPPGEPGLVVVFDGVTDVRNFGAIARTAECTGAHGLIVPIKNAAPVNAEAMKASAGALNVIPVSRVGSIRNTLKLLQLEGFQIVAATEKSDRLLYSADLTRPTAIVMGSEESGISKEVLKLCNEQIAIPLRGKIESLNVSAAAAVILYEVVRQRM